MMTDTSTSRDTHLGTQGNPDAGMDASPRPSFLDPFARMHAAMRRDAERLPRAIAAAGDASGRVSLRRWFECFRSTLEHHHTREDTIIWPELLRRDPTFETTHGELTADHDALDEALARVEEALAGSGDAAESVQQLAEVLVDHLAREERAAFPRLAACFTAEDWATIERKLLAGTSLAHLAFEVPWVLDALTADEVAELKAGAPRVLRLLHRLVFAPRYERVAAPLLAVAR
jgi:hypothetical protein